MATPKVYIKKPGIYQQYDPEVLSKKLNNISVSIADSAISIASKSVSIAGLESTTKIVTASKYYVSSLNTAPAESDPGTTGEIRFADSGIFVCTATNTWKKVDFTPY